MGQYLGEVVGEVQDVLHKVPTDGEGRIIRNRRKAVKMIQRPRQAFFRLSLDPMTMTLNQHHPMTACKLMSKLVTCRRCE